MRNAGVANITPWLAVTIRLHSVWVCIVNNERFVQKKTTGKYHPPRHWHQEGICEGDLTIFLFSFHFFFSLELARISLLYLVVCLSSTQGCGSVTPAPASSPAPVFAWRADLLNASCVRRKLHLAFMYEVSEPAVHRTQSITSLTMTESLNMTIPNTGSLLN